MEANANAPEIFQTDWSGVSGTAPTKTPKTPPAIAHPTRTESAFASNCSAKRSMTRGSHSELTGGTIPQSAVPGAPASPRKGYLKTSKVNGVCGEEVLVEWPSSPGRDGRSEARTQGVPVANQLPGR